MKMNPAVRATIFVAVPIAGFVAFSAADTWYTGGKYKKFIANDPMGKLGLVLAVVLIQTCLSVIFP